MNEEEPCMNKLAISSGSYVSCIVVDDILLIGNDIPMMQGIKVWLSSLFSIKDLGKASFILGMRIYVIDQ